MGCNLLYSKNPIVCVKKKIKRLATLALKAADAVACVGILTVTAENVATVR